MKQIFSVKKLSELFEFLDEEGYLEYRDQQGDGESLSSYVQQRFEVMKVSNPDIALEEVEQSVLTRNSNWTQKEAYQLSELGLLVSNLDAWHETFVAVKKRANELKLIQDKVKELLESNQETLTVTTETVYHFS